jgi:hypothetical protein
MGKEISILCLRNKGEIKGENVRLISTKSAQRPTWALIRPYRGRPTQSWLVGPRRIASYKGGGSRGTRYEVHRTASNPTYNPNRFREALPATRSHTASPPPGRHRPALRSTLFTDLTTDAMASSSAKPTDGQPDQSSLSFSSSWSRSYFPE